MNSLISSNIFLSSYHLDYEIYDNLISQITNNYLNKDCIIDKNIAILLEQPFKLLDYTPLKDAEEIEEYTKLELSLIINNLLDERKNILSFFEKINSERKKLREDNYCLLKKLLTINHETNNNIDKIIQRTFFLNHDFYKYFITHQEKNQINIYKKYEDQKKNSENYQLELEKLKEKLLKTRDNFKKYIINNNDDFSRTNSNDIKLNYIIDNTDYLGISNDRIPYELTQDWDNTSQTSHRSINKRTLISQNYKRPSTNTVLKTSPGIDKSPHKDFTKKIIEKKNNIIKKIETKPVNSSRINKKDANLKKRPENGSFFGNKTIDLNNSRRSVSRNSITSKKIIQTQPSQSSIIRKPSFINSKNICKQSATATLSSKNNNDKLKKK